MISISWLTVAVSASMIVAEQYLSDLIVNEATRLVGASAAYIRLLKGDVLVPSATTKSAAAFLAGAAEARGETVLVTVDERTLPGQVVTNKRPVISDDGQIDETMSAGGRRNHRRRERGLSVRKGAADL